MASEQQKMESAQAASPGVMMAGSGEGLAESGGARRRVLNLLSRHPDLVAGKLESVSRVLCDESALALGAPRVGLWQAATKAGVDRLTEVAFNGRSFEDQVARELMRDEAPAFFAGLERRRLLEGRGLHELAGDMPGCMIATVHVDGAVWGMLTFERASGARQDIEWDEAEFDFALLVAGMVGRCVERGLRASLESQLERAEDALGAFARMMGEALSFEVVDGRLECQGDPRLLLGPPPAGQAFEVDFLISHIREDEREILIHRFRDWGAAGAPGVLTARFHYTAGPSASARTEIELDCRLMRSRSVEGLRLWGVLRRA